MAFEIYIPQNSNFKIILLSHSVDKARLRASLAPNIIVDYIFVVPEWGQQTFAADDFIEAWLGPKKLGVKALTTNIY
ncbi:hypothetical protein BOTCAL_0143g00110 [Botryotinia calthae]|uniref:Uncharacterized protein n=1 Tax=Botryotinia calthae TaxID=38488 RepID=A0A4Y8D3F6_9HELO|nr:hypothetical protein BOTCAL_0143g00110 [Botryotinia calthae]